MSDAFSAAYESARCCWPDVELAADIFEQHLRALGHTRQAPSCAAEVYLACAAARGDAAACAQLERRYIDPARDTIGHLTNDATLRDALLQQVRDKLLVGPPPRLLAYAGTTKLESWIRLVSKRCAIDHFRSVRRQTRHLGALQREPHTSPHGLESTVDLDRLRELFARAVIEALRQLSTRDRTILRLHYASGASIDALGQAYGVHRATAARWIERIRGQLFEAVRGSVREQRALTEHDFSALAAVLQTQIDLVLSSWSEGKPP